MSLAILIVRRTALLDMMMMTQVSVPISVMLPCEAITWSCSLSDVLSTAFRRRASYRCLSKSASQGDDDDDATDDYGEDLMTTVKVLWAEEAEEETEAFNMEVRRVLATQFNIAGSLVPWEEQAPEGGGSGFLDDDDDDEERLSVGHVAAAKNIVWARRFKAMQIYGEIDACHMGDRAVMGDAFTEYPLVRFKSQISACKKWEFQTAGQVYLDGIPLKGEWRGGTRRPNRRGDEKESMPPPTPVEEVSSRLGSRIFGLFQALPLQKPEKTARPPRSPSPKRRKRAASRSRSRSRRRRKESPAKKEKGGGGSLSINTLAALLGLPENKDAGNPESQLSDNPLYRKK
eukprot:s2990_g5.t1